MEDPLKEETLAEVAHEIKLQEINLDEEEKEASE